MNKSINDRDSLESIIEFLEGVGADFTTHLTNYTTSIEYNSGSMKYLKTMRTKKCFAAFNQIKLDVSQHRPPEANEDNLSYFNHDIKRSFMLNKAIQIDIKKAYATVLKNNGYITERTYKYISSLNKNDRLASVGMLASIKHEFQYRNGKVASYKTLESKLKNFFFYCVRIIQEIMDACRLTAGQCYILTWVDAIYISYNERVATEIQRLLYYNGFDSERSVIYNFNCQVTENKIKLSLFDGDKTKRFNIPHQTNVLAKHIVQYINRSQPKSFNR